MKGSLHPGLAGGEYQILFSLCRSEKHRFSVRKALLRVLAPRMCLERSSLGYRRDIATKRTLLDTSQS